MLSISVNKCVKSIRFQQVFHFAKYVRKSKEELREELEKKRFDIVQSSIASVLKRRKCLSVSEWKKLVPELNSNQKLQSPTLVTRLVFAALLKLRPPNDSLQNARHFIEANDLKYDLALKRRIIELYAKKAAEDKLTDEEENELIQICEEFMGQDFHRLAEMHHKITQGLCATKQWKRAIDLESPTPSSLNILIRRALRENEIDLVWKLLRKLTHLKEEFQHITNKTVISFAKYLQNNPKEIPKSADQFLGFCEHTEKLFNEESAHALTKAIQKYGHQAKITKINYDGVCSVCQNSLGSVHVTEKEFNLVKEKFMDKVVRGNDIYQKTTPEEWKAFESVIHKNGPFDIVMDGLNVSFGANEQNYKSRYGNTLSSNNQKPKTRQRASGHSLAEAVKQLLDEDKRVLVIGRKHMEKWPKIDFIRQIATVYLVDNISKDDIFLLYAALYSGSKSYILSNDFMRQHKFAIGRQYDDLFKRWQQEHWYGFTFGKDTPIKLFKPMQFKMHCHKVNDHWHLPFKLNEEIDTFSNYELPKNWACIRLNA